MSGTLRERAEHAAKSDANLVVPATEIKQLLDEGGAMLGSIAALSARIAELQQNIRARDSALQRVREALAGHPDPRCEKHPDEDAVTCGWKSAYASVLWALDGDS